MKSLITEPLGLYGWKKAEPVLLAALLSEEPLLLVGAHGCAKSFVLERLAEALGMEFRSYNASLINYDDLVGVPLPAELHVFAKTPHGFGIYKKLTPDMPAYGWPDRVYDWLSFMGYAAK